MTEESKDVSMSTNDRKDFNPNNDTPWVLNDSSNINFESKLTDEITRWGSNRDLVKRQALRKERATLLEKLPEPLYNNDQELEV